MKKSGLADSPFFTPPEQKKAAAPPSPKVAVKKGEDDSPPKRSKRKTPVDQSTDRSTDRPTDRPIDKSTDRPIDQLTDIEALGPVVARPSAFYITQKVDWWLDEAVRYLKEKGLHKADRSVLVNAILHDPKLFEPSSLDELRSRLLAHLTNKALKRAQSTD